MINYRLYILILSFGVAACNTKSNVPATDAINAINLKKGNVIACGPPEKQFGTVDFQTSCSEKVKADFNMAVALLHSFEYDEAEKEFARVIEKEPGCAMAYWGVAMTNYHPLWSPPNNEELEKGSKAVAIAQSITNKTKREEDYINAIAAFYKDYKNVNHQTRTLGFETAMEKIYNDYPDDKEAPIFYVLALNAAADPSDKTYARQKKAGDILMKIYPKDPNHPGIIHYIIHTYDNPEMAGVGLEAARKYASIAPSSAHAQHMPSHIFTRLGLWDEDIKSNLASVESAKCYAESTGIKGHWDEEMHGLDYLMYSYLQQGDNENAKKYLDYVNAIKDVTPSNFKVAYAFAAIPCRYVLENKQWKEAANLKVQPDNFQWQLYPWQNAIIHFTRLLGSVHTNDLVAAKREATIIDSLRNELVKQKDAYKANQVNIQLKAGQAWIAMKEGKNQQALDLMNEASTMEDHTQKHPVTPGEVLPARELLADMYMQLNRSKDALTAYEADLKEHPNRFNGLYGAALASEKTNNLEKAEAYYEQLAKISVSGKSPRPELEAANTFIKKLKSIAKTKQ